MRPRHLELLAAAAFVTLGLVLALAELGPCRAERARLGARTRDEALFLGRTLVAAVDDATAPGEVELAGRPWELELVVDPAGHLTARVGLELEDGRRQPVRARALVSVALPAR